METNAPIKEEASEQKTQETAVPETASQEVIIPENWEAPIKEFFNNEIFQKIPESKKTFFDKFKSFDDGYAAKFNALAKEKKEFEAQRESFKENERFLNSYKDFEKILIPEHRTAIMSNFGSLPAYMARLYELDSQYSKDPLGFITGIMKTSGITPDMLIKGTESPEYRQRQASQNQANQLQMLQAQMQQQIEERLSLAKFENEVNAFKNKLDEAGNPAYPYLPQVANYMDKLREIEPSLSLEDAYERACYANPEIRAHFIKAQINREANQNLKAGELEKAKEAIGIKTTPKPKTIQRKTSDDVLKDLLDEKFGRQ